MHRLDNLYRGMTFGDVVRRPRHPQLVVTAADMSLGTGFEFTTDQFALIWSDLDSVPLSVAVAASSAVPILLSPVTLKNYSGDCAARAGLPLEPLPMQPSGLPHAHAAIAGRELSGCATPALRSSGGRRPV